MGKTTIKQQSHWGETREVTLPFTPECDGLFRMRVSLYGSGAYIYLKSDNESYWLCDSFNSAGGNMTHTAAVHKGITYSVLGSSSVYNVSYYFTPLI